MEISMIKHNFSVALAAMTLMVGQVWGQDNFQDLNSGKMFPKEVTVEFNGKNYILSATGASTRKKFIVKVYSIASYIEKPSKEKGIEQMLDPLKAKQLTQIFMRDIDKQKFTSIMNESLSKNISNDQKTALKPVVNEFLSFFTPVKKNDVHDLRWFPGGVIEIYINGAKVGTVQNEDFAVALWNIWFGKDSVVNRNEMVSLL
jgi:hypothetical protein